MTRTQRAPDPITPGEILLTEFLDPLGITQYRLAQATGLPQTRISGIARGKRAITTDTALRLSRALCRRPVLHQHPDRLRPRSRARPLSDEPAKVTALVTS